MDSRTILFATLAGALCLACNKDRGETNSPWEAEQNFDEAGAAFGEDFEKSGEDIEDGVDERGDELEEGTDEIDEENEESSEASEPPGER